MKKLMILGLVLVALGCGSQTNEPARETEAKRPAAEKAPKAEVPAKPQLDVRADSYAGLSEAIDSLTEAATTGGGDERLKADKWLVMQGDTAVEPLSQILNDEQAQLAARIAACRTLWKLGPNAKPALKAAIGGEPQLIRLNAVKGLGFIRPTDRDIIETLTGLLEAEEERVRRETTSALGNIGPPAADLCVDKLVGMLNNEDENETLRGAAKNALKQINPRRSFVD